MALRSLPKHLLYEIAYYLPDDINFAKCFDLDSITYEGCCTSFWEENNVNLTRRKLKKYVCNGYYYECKYCEKIIKNIYISKLEILEVSSSIDLKILPETLKILRLRDSKFESDCFCNLPNLEVLKLKYCSGSLNCFRNSPLKQVDISMGDDGNLYLDPLINCPIEKLVLKNYRSLYILSEFKLLKILHLCKARIDLYLYKIQNLKLEILILEDCTVYAYKSECFKFLKVVCFLNDFQNNSLYFLKNSSVEIVILMNFNSWDLSALRTCKYLRKIYIITLKTKGRYTYDEDTLKKYKFIRGINELKPLQGMDIIVESDTIKINMKTMTFEYIDEKRSIRYEGDKSHWIYL
jgi:hypothetical protein